MFSYNWKKFVQEFGDVYVIFFDHYSIPTTCRHKYSNHGPLNENQSGRNPAWNESRKSRERNVSPSEQDFLSELISRGPIPLLFSFFFFQPGNPSTGYRKRILSAEGGRVNKRNRRTRFPRTVQTKQARVSLPCSTVSWIIGTGPLLLQRFSFSLSFALPLPLSPRNTDFNPVWICRRPTRPGLSISCLSCLLHPCRCNAGDSFESPANDCLPLSVIRN